MSHRCVTNQFSLLRVSQIVSLKPSTVASVRLISSLPSAFARHSIRETPASTPSRASSLRFFSYTPIPRFSPTPSTMSSTLTQIRTVEEFNEKVLHSEDAVVLDCYAEWCGPCKAIAPKVQEFSEKYSNAKFYKIDVDELSEVAAELGVRAMPTFMLFKDGVKITEVVGANPPAIEAGIKSLLSK